MDNQSLWLIGALRRRKEEIRMAIEAETAAFETAMELHHAAMLELTLDEEYGPVVFAINSADAA